MRTLSRAVLLAAVALAGTTSAIAQVGLAVPVRCFRSADLAPGASGYLTCIPADGTAMVENQRVPPGYWLLLTDVLITPSAATAAGITLVTVFDSYGINSRQSAFDLRCVDTASCTMHFTAPYLTLHPDHRLEVLNSAASDHGVGIRASGLLVRR